MATNGQVEMGKMAEDTDNNQSGDMEDKLLEEPKMSIARIAGLCAYFFGFGSTMSSMGFLVLPFEMKRMYPHNAAVMLSVALGVVGSTQLVTPLVGYLSDRQTSRIGKRTYYLLWSAGFISIGCGVGVYASINMLRELYILCLVFACLGCNTAWAVCSPILADLVPESQMGTASAMMNLLFILGLFSSFAMVGLVFKDMYYAYGYYIICSVPTILITAKNAKEKPLENPRPIVGTEILASYWMSPGSHGDFFWATVMRFFLYMAVSVQAYGVYYLEDVVLECWKVPEDFGKCAQEAKHVQATATMLFAVAGILANPAGYFSDKYGRKIFVLIACVLMISVYIVMMFIPPLGLFYVVIFIYGIGNGVFMPVELALAVDVLPNPDNKARDLGIWGVASFLGSVLGPAAAGPCLEYFGNTNERDGYVRSGYVSIYALGTIYLIAALLTLRLIRGSK